MKFHYQIKGRTTIGWVSAIEVETTIGATVACKLTKCPLISCPQLDVIAHYVHNELHGMPEITFATAVCHADDKFDAEKGKQVVRTKIYRRVNRLTRRLFEKCCREIIIDLKGRVIS